MTLLHRSNLQVDLTNCNRADALIRVNSFDWQWSAFVERHSGWSLRL